MDNFAVFILSHGRPHNVKTYKTLRRQGYTGPIYIIIDNEDAKADEYYKLYGDQVVMFDKAAIARTFDEGDNFGDRRAVIYARNACWGIAEELGVDYFLQLDDDYNFFRYKFNDRLEYSFDWTNRLDDIFRIVLNYYKSTPALSLAFAQTGDTPGGAASSYLKTAMLKRKAMNSFFCCTDRPFQFFGRINEDVNVYVTTANRGGLFFSLFHVVLDQTNTQSNSGGMTEMYLDSGTYIKSFYSVMYAPSCVRVGRMRSSLRNFRLHHVIDFRRAIPRILSEEWRKP